jgi:hypothetical protein
VNPILVKVRMSCGAYVARAGKATASCTMDMHHAAASAAGKHFGVLRDRVYLKVQLALCGQAVYLALPATAPAEDLVGYKTALQISDERNAAQEARVYGRSGTPGALGDRLD